MWDILLVCLILCGRLVLSIEKYEISAVYLADTEKYEPYTEPNDESRWENYREDSLYLGHLFAGKSEFNWVVELRVHGSNQELRSTGNLVSSVWVLTTCRANAYLEEAWDATPTILRRDVGPAVAVFCQLYLWEYRQARVERTYADRYRYGGSRYIDQSVAHPKCHLRKMMYDVAMLKLRQEINPAAPYVGFMPALKVVGNDHKFSDIDLTSLERKRIICYVASIGRKYVNTLDLQHLVVDFKVRYRVYYEELTNCTNLWKRLCDDRYYCRDNFGFPHLEGRQWNCMRTRARVGTVCDHDRGAPVVCDEEVIGIVAYGATYKYCNSRIPMPFIVLKLHSYSDWAHGISLNPRNEPWDAP